MKKKAKKSIRRKGHAVTIDAVAAQAKVSPMTVSRVVSGQGNVRETTRERVLQAVQKLGYTPNLAASSLAAARGTRIALIYTNPSAAYLRELLVGALHGAARTAAQLVVDTWDGFDAEAERKAARALAASVVGATSPVGANRASCGRQLVSLWPTRTPAIPPTAPNRSDWNPKSDAPQARTGT